MFSSTAATKSFFRQGEQSQRLLLWLLLLPLCAALWSGSVRANEEPWRLYKKAEHISLQQRHIRQRGKKLLQVKVQLDYQGSMSAFLQVLADTNNAALWLHNVAQVSLLAKPSLYEDLVYTRFNAPWPLTERELVSCSEWQQQGDLTFNMQVWDCADLHPDNPGKLRLRGFSAHWQLKPLPDARVRLIYTGIADAGGKVPRFLSDPVALSSSWKSFLALQQQLQLATYQQAHPGICEAAQQPVSDACQALKAAVKKR